MCRKKQANVIGMVRGDAVGDRFARRDGRTRTDGP